MPSKKMPKNLAIGKGQPKPDEIEETESHEKRSGQILWIRGLTRLQTQVGKSQLELASFGCFGNVSFIIIPVYWFFASQRPLFRFVLCTLSEGSFMLMG